MKCEKDCHNIVLYGRFLTYAAISIGIPFFFQLAFWNKWLGVDWIFTIIVFFGMLTYAVGVMTEKGRWYNEAKKE